MIGGETDVSMREESTPEAAVAADVRPTPRATKARAEAAQAAMTPARRAGRRSWSKIATTAVSTAAMAMTTGVVLMEYATETDTIASSHRHHSSRTQRAVSSP